MWMSMLRPRLLCRQHLLGEHNELHKHLPSFHKGHKVHGRFYPTVQIQFNGYLIRHNELAAEMIRRGYKHKTPLTPSDLPDFKSIYPEYYDKKVNITHSIRILLNRCGECKMRIISAFLEKGGEGLVSL